MKSIIYFTFLFLVIYATTDSIIQIDSTNFQTTFDTHSYLFLYFYVPWSVHCQRFTPQYAQVVTQFQHLNNIAFAKVDATLEEKLSTKYSIEGYPTLLFLSNKTGIDNPQIYSNAFTADEVIAYVTKKIGIYSTHLETLERTQSFIAQAKTNLVCVFFGEETDPLFSIFRSVSVIQERILFGHTNLPEARTEFQVNENVKVVLFKNFDEKRNDFIGALDQDILNEFLNENSYPTVQPFNEKAMKPLLQSGNLVLFLLANESEKSIKALESFGVIAKEFKNKLKFSYSKPNDGSGLFYRILQYIGASSKNLPEIMLVDSSKQNVKYRFEQEQIDVDNLRTFIQNYFEGKLNRFLKTQEIPKKNDKPVKVLVAKQFKEMVIDNDNDVLVNFYAPWCKHCKTFKSIYEKIAKTLEQNKNITLAQCDSSENEIEEVEIEYFPKLYLWKNGSKDKPLEYEGEREFNQVIKWIKENTSNEYEWQEINEKKSDL